MYKRPFLRKGVSKRVKDLICVVLSGLPKRTKLLTSKPKEPRTGPNGLKPCLLNALSWDVLQKPVLVAKRVAGCLSMNKRLGKARAVLSLKVPGCSPFWTVRSGGSARWPKRRRPDSQEVFGCCCGPLSAYRGQADLGGRVRGWKLEIGSNGRRHALRTDGAGVLCGPVSPLNLSSHLNH